MKHITIEKIRAYWQRGIKTVQSLNRHFITRWLTFRQYHPKSVFLLNAGLVVCTLIALLTFSFLLSIALGSFGKLPNRRDLVGITNYLASEVYAEDGSLLGRYYIEHRSNTKYEDISEHFINALVATEDARYFHHNGVDLRSWVRVLFKSVLLRNRASGGGSTITQQLAKNLYPRQKFSKAGLLINKLKEVFIAQRLERLYSKEEILELYLNTVPFSENTYGIKVAAHRFFGTTPDQLDPSQSAILVAMLKATSTYNPISNPEKSLERRNLVLGQMAKYGYLNKKAADTLKTKPLQFSHTPLNNNEGLATYFREHLRLELKETLAKHRKRNGMAYNLYTDGLKIYTTLDAGMQDYAEQAVKAHLAQLQKDFVEHLGEQTPWEQDTVLYLAKWSSSRYKALKAAGMEESAIDSIMSIPTPMTVFDWEERDKNTSISPMDSIKYYLSLLNAGFLAMEPNTGEVKAWVGGIDHKYFKYDHVKSRRQVGSTFKPIVYVNALQQGIRPCNYISNHLRVYPRYENWMPRNADNKYGGLYSMEGGLINSINTVTVNLAMRSKPKNVAALAQQLGISTEVPRVPAIALGAVEVSLFDMVRVYGTFANRGKRPNLRYLKRIETADGKVIVDYEEKKDTAKWKQVLAENEADMINHMLKSAVNNGTGRRLRFRYEFKNDLAGKTGTSQNHSDGWFMGYNPKLAAGVWVGAESPAVRFRNLRLGQGANTALPVYANFLKLLNEDPRYENYTAATFPKPSRDIQAELNCPKASWPEKAPEEGAPPAEGGSGEVVMAASKAPAVEEKQETVVQQ